MRLFAALLILIGATPALAQERITSFDSRLEIARDGTLHVTETIDLVSEQQRIEHGIYRDLPTRYRLPRGGMKTVRLNLVGTERDGHPEPAKVEPIGGGVRFKIGNADTLVDRGPHRYVIRYAVTREIGRFEGFDELYWNVTGNGWIFPIDRASATIILPSPASFGQRATYTGPKGATGSTAQVVAEAPGRISFATTQPLAPYEGLTVAAAFPKGVVDPPSAQDRLGWWLADFLPLAFGAAGLVATVLFVLFAWNRVGRDPRAGTVVPLFRPPEGLSPAAVRYIERTRFDNRTFAATLVDLAVRGHLKLREEDGGWLGRDRKVIDRLEAEDPLSEPEREALDALAAPGDSITLEREQHAAFSAAKSAIGDDLKAKYEGVMFHRNLGWAAAAVGIMIGSAWLAAMAFLVMSGGSPEPFLLALAAAVVVGSLLLVLAARSGKTGKCLLGGLGLILVGGGAALSIPLTLGVVIAGGWAAALPLIAFPLVLLGFKLLPAPTKEGRATLDRIAGFKQYLSITEGERLDRMTAPDETIDLFERYLPYAIALEVENRWADRFAAQIAAAAAAQQGSSFGWYSGSHDPWSDIGGFTNDISDSLSASVATASTAPGSSGGGSSGGGGGGGGGGGW